LESEETGPRRGLWAWPTRLTGSPEERAITDFSIRTLARKLVISQDGFRAFPFLIAFFVISGFRAVCQFPAELPANWIFRLAEAHWADAARRAIRRHALAGLPPTLVILLSLELFMWDWRHVLLHGAFQLMTGALLIEAMFWTFDKVPFTCSYFPGNISLSLLAGLYLHGFTTTAFIWQISNVRWTDMWLFRRPSRAVRFDAEEPEIRAPDLT
jgi:hypothetical protein